MFVEALLATLDPATDGCPSVDLIPIVATTIITNTPMLNITAPGINIASLPSPAELDPMMRSGKPMMNKVVPTPVAAIALFLEDEEALDLNPMFKSDAKATTKVNPPIPMNMAPGMSIPRTSLFSSF